MVAAIWFRRSASMGAEQSGEGRDCKARGATWSARHFEIVIAGPVGAAVDMLIWKSWKSRLKAFRFH